MHKSGRATCFYVVDLGSFIYEAFSGESPPKCLKLKGKGCWRPNKNFSGLLISNTPRLDISVAMSKLLMKGNHYFKVETDPD